MGLSVKVQLYAGYQGRESVDVLSPKFSLTMCELPLQPATMNLSRKPGGQMKIRFSLFH